MNYNTDMVLAAVDEVLEQEGMGATVSRAQARNIAVKSIAAVQDRKAVLPREILRAATRTKDLTPDVQKRINQEGSKILPTAIHKYRIGTYTLAANTETKLIHAGLKVDREYGITNFENASLGPDEHMIIDRIGLSFGTTVAAAAPETVAYYSFGIFQNMLLNSEVNLSLGKHVLFENVPMKSFLSWESGAAPIGINKEPITFQIPVDRIWWDQATPLTLSIQAPKTGSLAVGTYYWRADFYGAGFVPNV